MVGFVGREKRRVCGEREMNTGESMTSLYKRFLPLDKERCNSRHKIGLEFVQINVERTVKTERRSDGRDNLSDETVKVRETGRNNTELLLADVVNSFIVNLYDAMKVMVCLNITSRARAYHERAVRVFKSRVSRKNRVIWLNHRTRKLGCGVHAELEFRFLSIIRGELL